MKSIVVILIVALAQYVSGQCNVCGTTSGTACISSTDFHPCAGGVADATQTGSCAAGFVCRTNVAATCVSSTTNTASCSATVNCQQCSADSRYACTSLNTYQLCFGTTAPSGVTFICPTGTYCDYGAVAPAFCVAAASSTPACQASISIPTSTTDSMAWCRALGRTGKYRVASDTTCVSYVYCYTQNAVLTGGFYACPGTTVFNPQLQQCVDPTTYTCV